MIESYYDIKSSTKSKEKNSFQVLKRNIYCTTTWNSYIQLSQLFHLFRIPNAWVIESDINEF